MRSRSALVLLLLPAALVALAACGSPSGEREGTWSSTAEALTTGNGSNLNGSNLNGSNLNGSNLNGSNLNGDLPLMLVSVSFEGVKLNGQELEATWLEGTEFVGRNGNGSISRGTDFLQSEFQGTLGDGRVVRLRIPALTAPAAGDDVWRYGVEYREDDNTWWPICKSDDGGTLPAFALGGVWDYRQGEVGGGSKTEDPTRFTFACEGRSAIAKCVTIGYKPWATHGGIGLAAHHQACVRLIRADYCGDGKSWTTDGTLVNLYDAIGIQFDTEDWYFESEWDQDGARCFSQNNRSNSHVECYDAKKTNGCGNGNHADPETLLFNELPTK